MWKTAVTSLISAVIGGLLVFFAMSAILPDSYQKVIDNPITQSPSTQKRAGGLTASEIYSRFGPGVVHVKATFTTDRSDFFGFFIPVPPQQQGADGSGFIIDKSGLIVTNAHVVQDSNHIASRITVVLDDKKEIEAKLLGTDPNTDIALLKIDPGKTKLNVIKLGDSSKLKVGAKVYAIGSPFGLDGTMTEGIISAINRTIDSQNRQFKIRGAFQTDAAVNPGNSGGPLFNIYGEAIGVNSQIATQSGDFAGIAFAIPSNTVKEVAEQIKKSGQASHAWMGIAGMQINKELADIVKLPVNNGVMVVQVVSGSPAEQAGLRGGNRSLINDETGDKIIIGGDIITKIDNKRVASMDDILDFVEGHKVGDKVKLEVYRGDKKLDIMLKLGERPRSIAE